MRASFTGHDHFSDHLNQVVIGRIDHHNTSLVQAKPLLHTVVHHCLYGRCHVAMCLILFSYQPSASMPLILGANRDEFYARPTLAANYWEDCPGVLAGRDQVAGGTWIGITPSGRFAALTNIRESASNQLKYRSSNANIHNEELESSTGLLRSRGELTRAFLTGNQSCAHYLSSIIDDPRDYQKSYAGFNLLIGEFTRADQSLFYLNNREEGFQKLSAGIYGLSNHRLDTPWPKIVSGKQAFKKTIKSLYQSPRVPNDSSTHRALRDVLENPTLAADDALPATGLSYESEKALSASFIKMPLYGTRTSTVITISRQTIEFSEKNYLPDNDEAGNNNNIPARKRLFEETMDEVRADDPSLALSVASEDKLIASDCSNFTLTLC